MLKVNKDSHPALWYILHNDNTPYECPGCPFADLVDKYADISNDPSEASYYCGLLEATVWGESAPCGISHWREKAQEELWLDIEED